MSVSEDRTIQPNAATAPPLSGIADPAPLGLAAFALTTFLLSAKNANWMTHASGNAFLGYAPGARAPPCAPVTPDPPVCARARPRKRHGCRAHAAPAT